MESERKNLSERTIALICKEFNVNERWLRTGEGGKEAMFNEDSDSALDSLMEEKRFDDMSQKILRAFWEMPPNKRKQATLFTYCLIMF